MGFATFDILRKQQAKEAEKKQEAQTKDEPKKTTRARKAVKNVGKKLSD